MRLLWGGPSNPEVNRDLGLWAAKIIGMPRAFHEPWVTLGVFNEELTGVVVFNNFQPEAGTIEIHAASTTPRWLTRPVIREVFSYCFDKAGCQLVVTRNSSKNKHLKRWLTSLGFKHVTIPRLLGRDEDQRIFWLTEEAWRSSRFHAKFHRSVIGG